MTPEEMVLTLRICGNHPKYESFRCKDCPWIQNCDHDGGGAELSLRAEDIIEKLQQENAKLRKARKTLNAIQDLPEMNELEKQKAKDTGTMLMICRDAAKQADMIFIAETMAEAADCIERLLMEVERLKKYENAIDQILKPDADEMMGREAGKE